MKYLPFVLLFLSCQTFSGEKGTFGIEVQVSVDGLLSPKLESLIIKSVVPELPADKAGIIAGDKIIRIEDCVIPGCSAKRAKKYMNKRVGEPLKLLILSADGKKRAVQLIAE